VVGKVRRCGRDPLVQTPGDLVGQDVARPAVFGRLGGAPLTVRLSVELVEQDSDVP
jgi:hypothetical protein